MGTGGHCLQKIKHSCCNKESIMRYKNGGLAFPSGKLTGRFEFTERFEMGGRREND